MGANAVDRTPTFVEVFKNKRAPLSGAVKGLNKLMFVSDPPLKGLTPLQV